IRDDLVTGVQTCALPILSGTRNGGESAMMAMSNQERRSNARRSGAAASRKANSAAKASQTNQLTAYATARMTGVVPLSSRIRAEIGRASGRESAVGGVGE